MVMNGLSDWYGTLYGVHDALFGSLFLDFVACEKL